MNISQGLTKRTLTIAFENCLCRTALNIWHINITSSSFASCKMRMSLVGYQISSNLSMAVFLDCQKLCVFRKGFFKSFSVMSADLRPKLEDFQNGFLKAVRGAIKIPDSFLWFPVISMRKSVVVRNNCRSTYRFVEKAPKGKVFQLHSALLLNVSNISSKKTKTFVGDIVLRSIST